MKHRSPALLRIVKNFLAAKASLAIGGLLFAAALTTSLHAADKLEPADKAWIEENYTKAEYRIPMRDGLKLFTAVYSPKDTTIRYPIWFTRTPYGIRPYGSDNYPDAPSDALKFFAREKFIFVLQDVRGRNGS